MNNFLPSIHYCTKMRLFTIILSESGFEVANAPDDRTLKQFEYDRITLIAQSVETPGYWFETEKAALDYMIDGQELY